MIRTWSFAPFLVEHGLPESYVDVRLPEASYRRILLEMGYWWAGGRCDRRHPFDSAWREVFG